MKKQYLRKTPIVIGFGLGLIKGLCAQEPIQTFDTTRLKEVNILTERGPFNGTLRYNSTVGTVLYQGKKNEQIFLDNTSSNLAINNTRQTFAKVPGINVWESDGSGTNVSIAARGLSPNRAWEFNIRQNGYDIAADPFGYPEAYYAPAFESLEQIQVIRGAGALQYGPQMGGMVNYISKTRIKGKKIGLESNQTVGSYGLFNSYTAVGGETERLNYYGYFQHRNANGWRENSFYNLNSGSFNASYQISNKIKVGGEYIIWDNLSQQPGGLTDSIFNYNPRLSYRSRNWMNINWQIASVFVNADFKNLKINWSTYSLMGNRRSVGNVGAIANTQGVVNYDNLNSNRTVDKDLYRNTGSELRFIYSYNILSLEHHLSGGLRYYNGNTQRVRGTGNSSVKPDFTILDPTKLSRDYNFATLNYAAFIENAISIGKQFTFVPGVRFENIQNTITGKQPLVISNTKQRFKILYGASAQYKFNNTINGYANYTQAYRPILFSDLIPNSTTDVINPNLKDASGYNSDIGLRGTIRNWISFDISYFLLTYNNRVGRITVTENSKTYQYVTNIASSINKGVESFIEANLFKAMPYTNKWGDLSIYNSTTVQDARYTGGVLNGGTAHETKLSGKKVEYAPDFISRTGLTYAYKYFSLTYQIAQTSKVYTDANNTIVTNGSTSGVVNGYQVHDITLAVRINSSMQIKTGINNLTDAKYATRRAGGYPGPGLLPADGRTMFVTLSVLY